MPQNNPLSRPTLEQVRTHEIGKFFEIESDGQRTIKTTTHPRWFEDKENTLQFELSISEEVYNILKHDGTVSKRWKNKKPKWISLKKSKTGKAHWKFHVRTPTGKEKWVDIHTLKRYRTPKEKVGRRPGGMSYKLRREVWRALENPEYTTKLLRNRDLFDKKRKPTKPVSIKLPDLSLALKQFLHEVFIKNLSPSDYDILDKWHKKKETNQEIIEKDLILQYTVPDDVNMLIDIATRRNWKAILTRLIEIRILDKNSQKRNSKKSTENLNLEIIVAEPDDPTQFSCEDCDSLNWIFDHKEGIQYCGDCGVEVSQQLDIEKEVKNREYESD